jgi:SAM-dependent methyltransferase
MTAQPQKDAFLETSTAASAGAWDDLLRVQVDLFVEHELAHLSKSTAWRSARTVTDVGCGNGYYLSRVRGQIPDKAYVGIDVSPELIAFARSRHKAPNLQYVCRDFLRDGAPPSDVILLRFVLQHLPDLQTVLTRATTALSPSGTILIVEPDLAASRCEPELPLFFAMLAAFESRRRLAGVLRGEISTIARSVEALPGWRVVDDSAVRVHCQGPFEDSMTAAAFRGWANICRRYAGFDHAFQAVDEEIDAWTHLPNARCDIGLRITEIVRVTET